jgi:hypothetical protein
MGWMGSFEASLVERGRESPTGLAPAVNTVADSPLLDWLPWDGIRRKGAGKALPMAVVAARLLEVFGRVLGGFGATKKMATIYAIRSGLATVGRRAHSRAICPRLHHAPSLSWIVSLLVEVRGPSRLAHPGLGRAPGLRNIPLRSRGGDLWLAIGHSHSPCRRLL